MKAMKTEKLKFKLLDSKSGDISTPYTISEIAFDGVYTDGLIPLQYTTMNDIEGVEIFEGDIIEKDDGRGGKMRRLVKKVNGSYRLVRSKRSNGKPENLLHSRKIYGSNLVVIGNVFNNPELLKTK